MKRVKKLSSLSNVPKYLHSEEEIHKAMETHNPFVFSSVRLSNKQDDIEEEMKHFSTCMEKVSNLLGKENHIKLKKKLEKIQVNNTVIQENVIAKEISINKSPLKRLVSMDFHNVMIKRLLSNSNSSNINLINEVVSSTKNSDKSSINNISLNVDFLKGYIKKENSLKKQLLKIKENKIYEFRNKFIRASPVKNKYKLDSSSESSSKSDSSFEIPSLKKIYAKTEASTISGLDPKTERQMKLFNTNGKFKSHNFKLNERSELLNTFLSKNSKNATVFTKILSTKNNFSPKVMTECSHLYDGIEKTEIIGRELNSILHKRLKKPIKKPKKLLAKSQVVSATGAQLIKQAIGDANSKGIVTYEKVKNNDGKLIYANANRSEFKESYDMVSNIKEVKAYQNKENLFKKFKIKFNSDDITFKMQEEKKKKESDNNHKKVNNIIEELEVKKRNLLTKIDKYQNHFKK
jgi:hypothetical protein